MLSCIVLQAVLHRGIQVTQSNCFVLSVRGTFYRTSVILDPIEASFKSVCMTLLLTYCDKHFDLLKLCCMLFPNTRPIDLAQLQPIQCLIKSYRNLGKAVTCIPPPPLTAVSLCSLIVICIMQIISYRKDGVPIGYKGCTFHR